jgi:hypothetical protein
MLQAAGVDQKFAVGVPPPVAAQLAGITPQAIHRAILRGTLRAKRFQMPGSSRATTIVEVDSLRAYIARNRRS